VFWDEVDKVMLDFLEWTEGMAEGERGGDGFVIENGFNMLTFMPDHYSESLLC
jgi:hypothetical protein